MGTSGDDGDDDNDEDEDKDKNEQLWVYIVIAREDTHTNRHTHKRTHTHTRTHTQSRRWLTGQKEKEFIQKQDQQKVTPAYYVTSPDCC